MIPAVGGGLCQLSNALYQVALQAGCEIVERHPHSRVVPGSATAIGRDATVGWNYIDLRFRPKATMQLQVMLTASDLHVSLQGIEAASIPSRTSRSVEEENSNPVALPGIFSDHACESCGNVSCFRHSDAPAVLNRRTVTAFLVDSAWPEFKTHVVSNHTSSDILCIPMDGERWNRLQYAWPTAGFAARHTATLTTLLRMLESRRLATQGAARQKSLLERADALARQLARSLDSDVDEVCVDQGLLPFLWRTGLLGGRRIRVFMTRLPLGVLEATLDRAFTMHPESRTLRDFRAEKWLVDAEAEALSYADEILTPHAQIASLFPSKRVLLNWAMTSVSDGKRPSVPDSHPTVLLPTSTLGRKGAYELREALDGLDITLVLGGKVLEYENFWSGYRVKFADLSRTISADLVVQPSVVESQPRGLLRALSQGVPVITTLESGLHTGCGATLVKSLDSGGLRTAIESHLKSMSK